MGDDLTVDVYVGDEERIGTFDWDRYEAAGSPWNGAIIKATQGRLASSNTPWFQRTWPKLKARRFRRGTYHYLDMSDDGAAQADFFMDLVDSAGGLDPDDFDPFVDAESARNQNATKDQVLKCTRDFIARVKERWGRNVTLYTNEMFNRLGILDHCGASHLWIARYTATLPPITYERIGWTLGELFGWQYCGDGEAYVEGYPNSSPIGPVDITAMVNGINVDRGLLGSAVARVVGAVVGICLLLWFFGR